MKANSFIMNKKNPAATTVAEKERAVNRTLWSSPAKIWGSRLSWRIALVVFATILVVQVGVFIVTLNGEKYKEYMSLRENIRHAVSQILTSQTASAYLRNPMNETEWARLSATTPISGIAIYSSDYSSTDYHSSDYNLLGTYGDQTTLLLNQIEDLKKYRYYKDTESYEFILSSFELKTTYNVVVKADTSRILQSQYDYLKLNIVILVLMSGFVTTVLMAALGRWLLEPMLFMRDNLRAAVQDPENPRIKKSPYPKDDEIGAAIDLAQNLITQNAENIKQIKGAAEDQIHRLAYYDSLTGLPNRILFLQKLAELARSSDPGEEKRHAVVTVDLDHFKDINDSMGHNIGDAILRAVGKRLRAALPESATVARTGEDEYAIMIPLADGFTSRDVGERVAGVIKAEPIKVFNENFQVRASIGVSTFPTDGSDPDQVLKNADIALNRAKEEGRDTIKEYSEDFDRMIQQRFQMLRDLRDALENEELTLNYQPQFDLKTGTLIGAEALLRWWRPDDSKEGGFYVSPADFIPVAENSGLIVPIGEWVLHQACIQAMEWQLALGRDIRVAVNVSGAQFHQSDLCATVRRVLTESGLSPHCLELEVTESIFMDDIQNAIQILQELHKLGVELAIDDFGTGYSSLSYLRQFPIDRLKIDQSFIRNALNNPDDASIAKTIVSLGHSLNLKVIAEGVETLEHEEFLRKEGCDEVQGFRYSRPVPHVKLLEFFKFYQGDLSVF